VSPVERGLSASKRRSLDRKRRSLDRKRKEKESLWRKSEGKP